MKPDDDGAYTAVPLNCDSSAAVHDPRRASSTPVPSLSKSDSSQQRQRHRSKAFLLVLAGSLAVAARLLFLLVILAMEWMGKGEARTFAPGGGRDWTLHVDEGLIGATHTSDPELVLGRETHPSLILVEKGSDDALIFSPGGSMPYLAEGGTAVSFVFHTNKSREPKKVVRKGGGAVKEYGPWSYVESAVVPAPSPSAATNKEDEEEAVFVKYVDSNFLQVVPSHDPSTHDDGQALVLDVAFGKYVPGNVVNFVGATHEMPSQSTFSAGGGRDWTLDEASGTISPKHATHLVLGVPQPRPVLVKRGSSNEEPLVFDNLDKLVEGEAVPLLLRSDGGGGGNNNDKGVGKMYADARDADPWRYVESRLVSDANDAAVVRYVDGKYLLLENEGMVLDVSYWMMEAGNSVNFVGGKNDRHPLDRFEGDVVDRGDGPAAPLDVPMGESHDRPHESSFEDSNDSGATKGIGKR